MVKMYEMEEARWIRENQSAIRQLVAGLAAVVPLEYDGQPIVHVDYFAGDNSPIPGLKPIPSYKAYQVETVRLDLPPNNRDNANG